LKEINKGLIRPYQKLSDLIRVPVLILLEVRIVKGMLGMETLSPLGPEN
jgi:hypothetical protein